MLPIELVRDIATLAKGIYDQVQLVKSNKSRWANLQEVIDQIVSALNGLPELPQQQNFVNSLERLHQEMQTIHAFVHKMRQMSYGRRLALARRHQSELDDFRQNLLDLIPVLQLGLSAQGLIDREKDRRAELEDKAVFLQEQADLLQQRQAQFFQERRELEQVLQKQMAAFQEQFERNWQQVEPTPSQKFPLPEQFKVNLYEITFEAKLVTSRSGDIYRASWNNQPVLVKFIEGAISDQEREQFIREARIMSQLHHDSLVPFYGACFEPSRMCIVTGIVEHTLSHVLADTPLDARYAMARDLAEGLAYLHQVNVIHSNIHPEHIGVTRHGLARWLDLSWVKTELCSIASLGIAQDHSVWQAPETWGQRHQVSPASDRYSFGWLLWTLYTGKLPFAEQGPIPDLLKQIQYQQLRETIPSDCPDAYAQLIQACWSADPKKRPDWSQMLAVLHQPLHRPASPSGEAYYEQGKQAEKAGDLDTALANYHRSSEKGYYKSYNSLGTFALYKGNQPKDSQKAEQYFTQGAQAGHAPAMFNLGRMHEKGETATKTTDLSTALFWYDQAHKSDTEEPRYSAKVNNLTQTLSPSEFRK